MKTEIDYTVMGEDGKEYGPVTANQIHQWVREQRLEKKTPVKPAGARDWIFLGQLPEFSSLFVSAPGPLPNLPPTPRVPPRRGLVVTAILVGLATVGYYLYLYLKPE